VLQHHGVAAWLRAWHSVPAPAGTVAPPADLREQAPGSGDELVAALATMALSCLAARR
jgi:hypothetical protein